MSVIPFYMGKWKKCLNECKAPRCKYWFKQRGFCGLYQCQWCGAWIRTGEQSIRIPFYKNKKLDNEKQTAFEDRNEEKQEKLNGLQAEKAFLTYHRKCYEEQHRAWIDFWFYNHPRKRKLRGGQRLYKDSKKANNLKTSIRYHKKQGHDTTELENKLKGLEVKGGRDG